MGQIISQNKTTYHRSLKDEEHPFTRLSSKLFKLDGYQLAIMAQILSNSDDWKIIKKEIRKRLSFPRQKFDDAWKSLIDLGYMISKKVQRGCEYIIYEEPDFISTTGSTSKDGMLTTINKNYYTEVTDTMAGTCETEYFTKLYDLYPEKGFRSDGTTYPLKNDRKKCEKAFKEYLKTGTMTADEMLTAYEVEQYERKNNGKTDFQSGLFNWLSNKTFEKYRGMSKGKNARFIIPDGLSDITTKPYKPPIDEILKHIDLRRKNLKQQICRNTLTYTGMVIMPCSSRNTSGTDT